MEETQLLIFDIPKADIIISNENQKLLEYEKREKNSLIQGFHFKSFYEMEDYANKMEIPDTNVISLLLKYCISYVHPIIIQEDKSDNKTINITNKKNKIEAKIVDRYHITLQHEEPILCYIFDEDLIANAKYGGKAKKQNTKTQTTKMQDTKTQTTKMQDTKTQTTKMQDTKTQTTKMQPIKMQPKTQATKIHTGKTQTKTQPSMQNTIIPSNKQMNIVGIMIPDKLLRIYNHAVVYFECIRLNDFAQAYGLYNFQTLRFTQQSITNFGLEFHLNKNKTILFFDEKDAMNKIKILIQYLLVMYEWYSSNFLLTSLEMNNHVNKLFKQIEFFKTDYKKMDLVEEKIASAFKIIVKSNSYAEKYLFLENNSFDYIYNTGKILGIDSSIFSGLLDKKKTVYKNNEKFIEWKQKGFKQKLQIIQKKLIAFDKYGTDELDDLDKKQLTVVNLEYNKKINIKSISAENQELFNTFEQSFNDISNENIKKNLNKIKAMFPNLHKQLDIGLGQDGICYHLIRQAETIIKHFKQRDLNTELFKVFVEEFALPKTTAGYFCKICGSQLLEADNESGVRFSERNEFSNNDFDNPIKTLIWKETIFIITTYIKFIKPMPIKPLINSIVSGLYEVIHQEEIRLLNNKTNISANIRDILIIYTNIYIYAILSVMLLNNPTKMIFGRDDPNRKGRDDPNRKGRDDPNRKGRDKTFTKVQNQEEYNKLQNQEGIKSPPINSIKEDVLTSSEYVADDESTTESTKESKHNKEKKYSYKGGAVTNDKKVYEKFLLLTSINLILISKDITIKKSPLFSADSIREEFLQKAYPWALSILNINNKEENEEKDSIIKKIESGDSFYDYIYYVKKLYNQNLKHDDFTHILGRTENQINSNIKTESPYGTIKLPERFKKSTYNDYAWESFMSIYDYTMEEINQHNFLKKSPIVNDYYEKYNHVLTLQKEITKEDKKKNTIQSFKIQFNNKPFDYTHLDLTQFYCSTGQRHKINNLIFKDGSKTVELSVKEATDIVKSKDDKKIADFARYTLVNERCQYCKELIRNSTIKAGQLENFNEVFKKLDHISAFFQYYKDRCPVNELHEIKDDKCKKCNISTNELDSMDKTYYNKYVDRFKKVEGKNQGLILSKLKHANNNSKDNSKRNNSLTSVNDAYVFSMKNLAEWSKLSNVKYSLLLNIGLTEEYRWEDMEKSGVQPHNIVLLSEKKFSEQSPSDTIKITPVSNPIERNDPNVPHNFEEIITDINLMDELNIKTKYFPNSVRFPVGLYKTQALKLKGYILQIVRLYNTVLNYEDVSTLSQELKDIIILQKNINSTDIKKHMPNITDDFHKLDQEYKYKLTSKNYANFLSETLSSIFIKLHNVNKSYLQLANGLIKYFETLIMKQERLFSRPEPIIFNPIENNDTDESNGTSGTDTTSGEFVREDHATPVDSESNEEGEEPEKVLTDITFDDLDVENANDVFELE